MFDIAAFLSLTMLTWCFILFLFGALIEHKLTTKATQAVVYLIIFLFVGGILVAGTLPAFLLVEAL